MDSHIIKQITDELINNKYKPLIIINRPGEAGAVLQSPPSLIDSLINSVIL